MRYLKTSEAAAMLGVAPNTLRMWERRFGFPKPQRSPGGHRAYAHGEVAALREHLQGGVSISAAIVRARAGLAADAASLVHALTAYDAERADRAIEATLALRSVERSVEEVLLPSLDEIVDRHGHESAAWAFAARWGADWLSRARRLTPPHDSRISIVLGLASFDELDLDAAYVRALELFCVRAGIKVLSLPARAISGIRDAAAAHRADLVVLAGGQLDDQTVAWWAHRIANSVRPLPIVVYRSTLITVATAVLPPAPTEAQLRLVELACAPLPTATLPLEQAG